MYIRNILNPSSQKRRCIGFTLIELLVVIAIIGLLSSIVAVGLKGAQAKARDSKRIAELDILSKAQEFYYDDYGKYPGQETWVCIEDTVGDAGGFVEKMKPYLPQTPQDPLYPKEYEPGKKYCYNYKTEDEGREYKIYVKLEKEDSWEISSSGGGGIAYPPYQTGESCNSDDECLLGICGTDVDGDGFLDETLSIGVCWAEGTLRTDCYDANANAKPGQTSYFSSDRGDGSFDYNCDGSILKQPNTCSFCTCSVTGTCNNDCGDFGGSINYDCTGRVSCGVGTGVGLGYSLEWWDGSFCRNSGAGAGIYDGTGTMSFCVSPDYKGVASCGSAGWSRTCACR